MAVYTPQTGVPIGDSSPYNLKLFTEGYDDASAAIFTSGGNLFAFSNWTPSALVDGLVISKSTDGGVTWTNLDTANGPVSSGGGAACAGAAIQRGTTLTVAWFDASTPTINLQDFDLTAGTWGAVYGTSGSPTTGTFGISIAVWYRASDNGLVVIYGAAGGSGLYVSVYDLTGGAWGSAVDVGTNITGLPNYIAASPVIERMSSCIDSASNIYLFFSTSQNLAVSNDWSFRVFMQQFTAANGVPNTAAGFFDFPGQGDVQANLNDFNTQSLDVPCIVGSNLFFSIDRYDNSNPPFHIQYQCGYLAVGIPAISSWVESTIPIDPDHVLGTFPNTALPSGGMSFFDGTTLYCAYRGNTDPSDTDTEQIRLTQCTPTGNDPGAFTWTAQTVCLITDAPFSGMSSPFFFQPTVYGDGSTVQVDATAIELDGDFNSARFFMGNPNGVTPPATGCQVAWLAINEPGNTLTPTGAWTARENEAAAITLKTFDSRATTGGIYDANLSWGSCTGVNQGALIALTSANAVDLVQSDSDAQTGSFSSFNLAFPSSNAANSTLVVDIAFAASTYTAGPTSVTDSQGNTYTKLTGGHPAFQGWFLETWIVAACAAGANTVTVSIAGLFPFVNLSIAIHEYAGVSAAAQVGDYGAGPLFGTGSPVNLSVTSTAPALLHLATATTTACPGATVGGGGNLPNVWTDQSHRLHVSESITISWIVRQRGTAHIPLTISGDDDYMPTIGSQVCLWDITDSDDFEVFSGTIDDFEVKWNGQTGQRIVTLTCVSLEQVFDTIRLPNLLFENKTAGFIFTALFAYASGSPVTLGTVGAGATIANFLISDFPSIADAFTRLARLSEYVWGVDPGTGSVYFTLPNTTPSPFTLDAEDVLWEQFTLKEERHDYRNWQGLKVSDNVAVQSSELFVGTGQSSFTMLRPIAQITNAWLTQNIQNFATGTFTGQPSPGDTISFGFTSGWTASEPIGTDQIIVDENGYAQKCTVPGTTGLTEPVWVEVYGEFTTDNTVQWQNQGIAGFGSGLVAAYTFVTALDNTQFGQVLIGATLAETIQNLADAINAIQSQAGVTFSLPTWENPEVNADEPPSSTQIIVRNKPAGSGFVTALHETCANFSWSSDNTTGGLTTFGTDVITFGVRGQTTGGPIFTIVYTPGSNIVTSATPLDAGNRLQIQYKASDAGYVIVENTPEVETRAAIEGGTGKYQQTSSDDQALSLPEALQLAQQQLAAFGVIPQTFQFTCMRAGLYVGQVLTIVMENPSPSLTNADWFIQEIQAEVVPIYGPNGVSNRFLPNGGHFKYTITCIDVAQIGSWIDFWLGLGGGSSGGGSFAGSGALGPGGASASSYSQTFVGITTLTVTHGLNTENVVVGVYDGSGNMVIPSSVQITGANTVDLVFGVATSGRVVIIGGQ